LFTFVIETALYTITKKIESRNVSEIGDGGKKKQMEGKSLEKLSEPRRSSRWSCRRTPLGNGTAGGA
jgi:hypothetical protein